MTTQAEGYIPEHGDDQSAMTAHFLLGARQGGARSVVLAPGSRSTPLVAGLVRSDALPASVHIDERTAGFAALGEALATGKPSVLFCTSGTAAVNFLPAITEARTAGVPMLIITADRPPELRSWGPGQTIDQVKLFGDQVVDYTEMPIDSRAGTRMFALSGLRAALTSIEAGGPVHINWPFRKPLEPRSLDPVQPVELTLEPRLGTVAARSEVLQQEVSRARRGLILAGPQALGSAPNDPANRSHVLDFARALGWPIIADVTSGLWGADASDIVVDAASFMLGSAPSPDVVLRMGDMPTTASVRNWYEGLTCRYILVDPARRWQDPNHRSEVILTCEPATLKGSLPNEPRTDPAWLGAWIDQGQRWRRKIERSINRTTVVTEASIARAFASCVGYGQALVASSMPIRDLDTYAPVTTNAKVFANRGANGIDGLVATATGLARATNERVHVLIGDVALLHDIGSVLDADRQGADLTIVVVNNDGGTIFSALPIARTLPNDTFDAFFRTNHGTDFSFLDAHPSITYRSIVDGDHFTGEMSASAHRGGVTVLEVTVDPTTRTEVVARIDEASDDEARHES